MPAHKKHFTEEDRRAAKRAAKARYRAANREKLRADGARYYQENIELLRAKAREHHVANSEVRNARSAAWRRDNPERAREQQRRWARENADLVIARAARRRARMRSVVADLTSEEWAGILAEFNHQCAYCDRRDAVLEQDHVWPISRGGGHTAANVVPACRSCNASKNDSLLADWLGFAEP